MTIWLMWFAFWITKATNTHSEYVILIAFSRQKRLLERTSVLPYITLRVLLSVHFSSSVASDFKLYSSFIHIGDRGRTVVKALCYKSEGRWFDSRWCHWNFSLT